MRDRFQKQRHATTVGIAAAREHQLQLGWSQEEMLDHFLVRIRGSELRIHIRHGQPPGLIFLRAISQNGQNRNFSACRGLEKAAGNRFYQLCPGRRWLNRFLMRPSAHDTHCDRVKIEVMNLKGATAKRFAKSQS
jgi:hypothetical protein